jgi:hypothetical protein
LIGEHSGCPGEGRLIAKRKMAQHRMTHITAVDPNSGPASFAISKVSVGDYIALMKPRVMSLVVFTALVGLMVTPGHLHPAFGFAALLCIAIGASAAGALNMWYGRCRCGYVADLAAADTGWSGPAARGVRIRLYARNQLNCGVGPRCQLACCLAPCLHDLLLCRDLHHAA